MQLYTVKEGDTLAEIARRAGVSPAQVREVNGIHSAHALYAGQTLMLPPPCQGKADHVLSGTVTGELFANGWFDRRVATKDLDAILPHLTCATECEGSYTGKTGAVFPRGSRAERVREAGVLPLWMPETEEVPDGKVGSVLADSPYGGMVLACQGFPTAGLVSAVKQLWEIYKKLGLCLFLATTETDLTNRPSLWGVLAEVSDGVYLFSDRISTPWEERLRDLYFAFPKAVRRRIYPELPYCARRVQGCEDVYLPLSDAEAIKAKRPPVKREDGVHWRYAGGEVWGEDIGTAERAMTVLGTNRHAGVGLQIGYTPAWVFGLLTDRFTLRTGCQTDGKRFRR